MDKFKNFVFNTYHWITTNRQRWVIRLKKASVILLNLSILFLPFNWLPYFSKFKEFSRAGFNYPMYLACIVVLIYKLLSRGKYEIPHNKLFYLFVICIVFISIFGGIVSVFTLSTEINNHFQLFIDFRRLIYQEILLLLFTIFSITIYNIVVDNKISLEQIRNKYIQSFYIPALYSIAEIIYIYTGHFGSFLLKTSLFLRPNWSSPLYLQLHSVSLEPAWFGIYIGGLFAWLCSYWFQKDGNNFNSKLSKYVLYPFLIFITVLTSSRFAYAIIVFNILFFTVSFLFKSNNRINKKVTLNFLLYTIIILSFSIISLKFNGHLSSNNQLNRNPVNAMISLKSIFANPLRNPEESIPISFQGSNTVRIGGVLAAINTAIHYPFTGVGMGQCPRYNYFYSSNPYKNDPAIINAVNAYHENTRLSAQNLLARLSCEEGFLGLGIFLSIFILAVFHIHKSIQKQNILQFSLFVSFCNFLAYMFVYDIFTFSEYWLILPLTWVYFSPSFFVRSVKDN